MNYFVKRVFLLLGLVAFYSYTSYTQERYAEVDAFAENFSESVANVEELATKLTAGLESEEDKARVFYMWLANNVRYDCKKFHNPQRPEFKARSKSEVENMKKEWRAKQIQKSIKTKKGVCSDYSQLFKALCDVVGMEAEVVTGVARNFYRPFSKNHSRRHAWNAVKIDGEWKLLDATWGAGHTNPEVTKFTRNISPGFFFVPPAVFMQNHWPDEEHWQLLSKPITKQEFAEQANINYGQENYNIIDFSAEVKVVPNGKEIWLEFAKVPKMISATSSRGRPVKFEKKEQDGKVILTFLTKSAMAVTVFGGDSPRRRFNWLAKYKL